MAQILVRGLEPAVIERLKRRAIRNQRSLAAEVRVILTEAERDPEAFPRAVQYADEMRRKYAGKISGDSTDIIREARDSR